jgi:hypothetical protein
MAEFPLFTAPARAPGRPDHTLIGFEVMPEDQRPAESRPELTEGTEVDVRTGFDRSWASGFQVAEVTDVGYRLRRTSDRTTLPVVFPHDDVRRHRSSFWWV